MSRRTKFTIDDLKIEQAALKGFYYLATPYSKWSHGIDDANHVAQLLTGKLIFQGVGVYSPIAHTHGIAIASQLDPYDHSLWMPADKFIADAAKGLLVADLSGWKESKGVAIEIEWFKKTTRPCHLLNVVDLSYRNL